MPTEYPIVIDNPNIKQDDDPLEESVDRVLIYENGWVEVVSDIESYWYPPSNAPYIKETRSVIQ